jgi:iron complex outermembrane receptor protein
MHNYACFPNESQSDETKMNLALSFPTASLAIVFAFATGLPEFSLSQESGTNATATNAPDRLPTVTVTAQKEPQPAQSLPVSVTAVTRQTIRDADIRTVKEASIYAPDTFVNEFTARAVSNPFFRGIGGGPLNPGVTTFIDGVPQLNSYSSSIELMDVDQVEFVRGPQGALFGRNTAGGLINITSSRPANIWTGGVEGSYGNYDFRDVRGGISGPMVKDQLALSVAGGYSARQGYTVNDFTGHRIDSREAGFGKGQLLYRLNDRLELRLILSGEHDHDGDYALGDLGFIRANPHHVSRDFEGFNHRDVTSGTLLANYYSEAVDISSISGGVWWRNRGLTDLDYSTASLPNFGLFATRDNVEEEHQFTQEFRAASSKDKPLKLGDDFDLSWQSGVFLFSQSYNQSATNSTISTLGFFPPSGSLSTADLDDWGVGVYGQTKLTAWEKLDFIAGVRYDHEDKRANLFASSAPPEQSLGHRFDQVSPQGSIAYHFLTNQMAYASVARGYRAGGFNPVVPASSPGASEYGTEHTWNYEIGHKARWLDGKLETTLALFYIDWKGFQLNQPVGPSSPGQFYIANAGAADSKGVEFELKYRPVACWDLFGGVGYTKANFLSGSTAYNANAGVNQPVGGNRLPYAPTFTGNMGTEVRWSPCSAATLYARAEVTVYGDFVYDASNTPGVGGQPTYSIANFRAGMRGNHWFVEGWADNAFDTHYVPIAIQYGLLGAPSGYVGESGAPVTYGVRAGINF